MAWSSPELQVFGDAVTGTEPRRWCAVQVRQGDQREVGQVASRKAHIVKDTTSQCQCSIKLAPALQCLLILVYVSVGGLPSSNKLVRQNTVWNQQLYILPHFTASMLEVRRGEGMNKSGNKLLIPSVLSGL